VISSRIVEFYFRKMLNSIDVNELMLTNEKKWDKEKIESLFL
jgi:hypothetical protein